jgi:hypothetical protein
MNDLFNVVKEMHKFHKQQENDAYDSQHEEAHYLAVEHAAKADICWQIMNLITEKESEK